ncbi:hypothetical protein SUGI_0847740 [Cryptomeria japonica]|nr:hypothetical protein SUGI_0847740 [Cryptomeria japonica]
MPSITRPARQTDYALMPRECPLVIDNGAFSFRIGWAGEVEPRFVFRNGVHKLRHKASGDTVNVIGDFDHGLMKFFESGRSNFRSAFDGNVVYQFEYMEYILDYAFERMGAEEQVGHPILMTECLCNPNQSRSKMAELLFETYDIPSIAFGIDAAFSYNYNQQIGNCDDDGLVVYSGHNTSHVIPVLRGEPVMEACCRTNIGGSHITEYMNKLLLLQYPYHRDSITLEKVEELKKEHCYVAEDYSSELQIFQKASKEAEEKTRYWQLPWVPPPQEKVITEEELARKAAIKEKQGQRLREMAAAKRSSKIAELESEVEGFEQLLQQLDYLDEPQADLFSTENGFGSRQEIESALAKSMTSLRKLKGEPTEVEKEKEEVAMEERYPLINIPNSMLTSEQIKEKKRQLFLKTTSEGRAKAKQKRQEEELQRERENQQDEERRLENPELYLEQLRAKQAELAAKVEQRKRLKVNGFPRTNNNVTVTGGVGRGERLNAAQRERMRLLTTAAFDRGKGEDTFGQKDEDWQLYKKMSKDNDDDDDDTPDQDEAELARLNARLQELDPTFLLPSNDIMGSQPTLEVQQPRPLTAEDFRITLGVERFRCPEILFQPHMIGIDQAGLDEMATGRDTKNKASWIYSEEEVNDLYTYNGNGTVECLRKQVWSCDL